MKKKINLLGQNMYLLLAILAGSVSLFFTHNSSDDDKVYQSISNSIRQNLSTELQNSKQVLRQIKAKLQSNQDKFSDLSLNPKYPIFIFEDEELLYWSSYEFNIDFKNIPKVKKIDIVEAKNGLFIVQRSSFKQDSRTFHLLSLIPLTLKYKIKNPYIYKGLNPAIFPSEKLLLSLKVSSDYQVSSPTGDFLFSLKFPSNFTYQGQNQKFALIASCFLFLFIFLQVRLWVQILLKKQEAAYALLVLFLSLLVTRLVMLFFDLPNSFFSIELFASSNFASSYLSPSLGDLLLNTLAFFLLIGFVFVYLKELIPNYLHLFPLANRRLLTVGFSILSFFSLSFHIFVLASIYLNSQISLDISRNIDFNTFQLSSFAVFILTAMIYFFINHIIVQLLKQLQLPIKELAFIFLFSGAVFILLTWHFSVEALIVFVFNAIYASIVLYINLLKKAKAWSYLSFIYLFFGAISSATIGAYSIYQYEEYRDEYNKQQFADQLRLERDLQGEIRLRESAQRIENDPIIINRMLSPLASKEVIIKKIKRFYLGHHFSKYQSNVYLFNERGDGYNSDLSYSNLVSSYKKDKYRSDYPNLYFVNDVASNSKRYFYFIDIFRKDIHLGYIVLELKLKKYIANSIYPNLLLETENDYLRNDGISYAIYAQNDLIYGYGNFNYSDEFLDDFKQNSLDGQLNKDGYNHLFSLGNEGQYIIISSPSYPLLDFFSNFSFLFLMLVLALLLAMLIYRFYFSQKKLKINLSTKIQMYLNLAFFAPTLIVSLLIVSILSSENKSTIIENYYTVTENISLNIASDLEQYEQGKLSKERLLESLSEIAKLTQNDINLFNKKGKLVISTQPFIYNNALLSRHLNPQAVSKLLEQNQSKIVLEEAIGSLNFSSAYVAVKSSQTGNILGIVSIPFFESQTRAKQQIIDVVNSVTNLFTISFIALLALAYFLSIRLTEPLKMLAEKFQKTSFGEDNQAIEYRSDDEIGLLVKEYNGMLVKLEKSKEALARNEKESAWREIAKQVAHEIKNPLTPMKLTLQHLKRRSVENSDLKRPVDTLLTQIDILNDIATSFSAFAKMPRPKDEMFTISEVLAQTLVLYKNNEEVNFKIDICQGDFLIRGDDKLTGRIFTNIILNAIQSVPDQREKHIEVTLQKSGKNKILLTVKDNGKGISLADQERIFLPSFTTKSTGTGIGLAVAKRGVELTGGKIWFETKENIGTTFFIEYPLVSKKIEKKQIDEGIL